MLTYGLAGKTISSGCEMVIWQSCAFLVNAPVAATSVWQVHFSGVEGEIFPFSSEVVPPQLWRCKWRTAWCSTQEERLLVNAVIHKGEQRWKIIYTLQRHWHWERGGTASCRRWLTVPKPAWPKRDNQKCSSHVTGNDSLVPLSMCTSQTRAKRLHAVQ